MTTEPASVPEAVETPVLPPEAATETREPVFELHDVRYLYGTYLADEQNDAWRTYLFLSDSPDKRA